MNIPSQKLDTAYQEYKKGTLDPKELTVEENLDLQYEYFLHQKEIMDPDVIKFVKLLMIASESGTATEE
jgi:hypothetical protein